MGNFGQALHKRGMPYTTPNPSEFPPRAGSARASTLAEKTSLQIKLHNVERCMAVMSDEDRQLMQLVVSGIRRRLSTLMYALRISD